jgi:hypothetical protein
MELNVQLHASDDDPLSDLTRIIILLGAYVYLDVTLPNISYPIHILSLFFLVPPIFTIVIVVVVKQHMPWDGLNGGRTRCWRIRERGTS